MFKLIVAGSRAFKDYELLVTCCDNVVRNRNEEIEIVSGGARGADTLGERYARERGFNIKRFPADWATNGRGAGFIRNKEMAEYADALMAFFLDFSKGTAHMIQTANQLNLEVYYERLFSESEGGRNAV